MKTETKQQYSCVDCGVTNCNKMDKQYPEFCLTDSNGWGIPWGCDPAV